ncbi:hypothetical protein QZH41_004321 [Actinostola sp. cb2023]|nr:hypothetical protein QZH41_004321 [Actinostola sp. cb2023]
MTALVQATHERRWRQAKLLIDIGCSVHGKGENGRTPLMEMCFVDNEDAAAALARVLIEKGAEVDAKDNDGRTVFSNACLLHRPKLFALFMKFADFDLNSADHDGNTALFHAITAGDVLVVKVLIAKMLHFGLKADVLNAKGETPLIYALKSKRLDIAEVLVREGKASLEARDLEFQKSASQWREELTKSTDNTYTLPPVFLTTQKTQSEGKSQSYKVKTGSAKHQVDPARNHFPQVKTRPVTAPDRIIVPAFLRPSVPIIRNLNKLYLIYNQQTTDSYRHGYKPIKYRAPIMNDPTDGSPNKSGVSFNQVNELSIKLQGLYKNSVKRTGVVSGNLPSLRSAATGTKTLKSLTKTVQQFEWNKNTDGEIEK